MSGLQPFGFVAVLTQGYALGWDMAAPLALSELIPDLTATSG